MAQCPYRFSLSIVFTDADQSVRSKMTAVFQIPHSYMIWNLEHSNITLSLHWRFPPWVWYWLPCQYGLAVVSYRKCILGHVIWVMWETGYDGVSCYCFKILCFTVNKYWTLHSIGYYRYCGGKKDIIVQEKASSCSETSNSSVSYCLLVVSKQNCLIHQQCRSPFWFAFILWHQQWAWKPKCASSKVVDTLLSIWVRRNLSFERLYFVSCPA